MIIVLHYKLESREAMEEISVVLNEYSGWQLGCRVAHNPQIWHSSLILYHIIYFGDVKG